MRERIPDPVRHPAHYEMYPVQPIEMTRRMGFCLGNAVKYALRAPYKGGVEDCDKALQYLSWEREAPFAPRYCGLVEKFEGKCLQLEEFLCEQPGDMLWRDIAEAQRGFLEGLRNYIFLRDDVQGMVDAVRDLSRVLQLRDTTGQIYEGMSGLPQVDEDAQGGAHE